MSETVILKAEAADAATVAALIREMLREMVTVGGHPVAADEMSWAQFTAQLAQRIGRGETLCLLAAESGQPSVIRGVTHASVASREILFEPARVLHVHALYVHPNLRRRGIGRTLLRAALEWGREEGCTEADLSVLVQNPARALYESMGFRALQTEMMLDLQAARAGAGGARPLIEGRELQAGGYDGRDDLPQAG